MWGTQYESAVEVEDIRFIPTHVGNSSRAFSILDKISVHPHACGELCYRTPVFYNCYGSSPRMWGTLHVIYQLLVSIRFIPTHVGNSSSMARIFRILPVHPHACGELMKNEDFSKGIFGSSPRMWGTLLYTRSHESRVRFIPTHVGNSSDQYDITQQFPVHPHACGELGSICCNNNGWSGSSPRMWGTQFLTEIPARYARFIPTHVGNSVICTLVQLLLSVHPHACGELSFG